MSARLEAQIRHDEEIIRSTLRAMIVRAGVLLAWLVIIVGICIAVLLLR